ncbi:MAG: TolC family protein [Candidatus Tectomicrobia bacterium]|nr:TolC family protein [Candidatus Tectomicrobia bacterium]
MNRRLLWLAAFVAMGTAATAGAQSEYRKLYDAFEQYQPPAHLFATPTHSQPVAPGRSEAYEAEKERLLEFKARWRKELDALSTPVSFYQPDGEVLAGLREAAGDTSLAQQAVNNEFELHATEVLALLRSPAVQAAEKRMRAAIERYSQVSAVDDILRRYSAFAEGVMTGVGAMQGHGGGQARFPFPAVLALKGRIVTQEVLASRERLEAARRDAVTAARKRHWQLWYLHRAVSITASTIGLLRELEQVSITRYEAGRTSFQDVIKVQLQGELLEERLTTLREQMLTTHMELREVLRLPPDTQIGVPRVNLGEAEVPELASLYEAALLHRQELRALRARLGKMDAMIEMAETMLLPGFDVGLSRFKDHAIRQVGAQANQPAAAPGPAAAAAAGQPGKPWFGFRDSALREMRQKRLAMRHELARLQDATLAGVRRKWFSVDRAAREKRLYHDTVVQLSEAALEVSTSGYESDRVAFADVIASYTLWLDSNLALAEKRGAYGASLAELEQTVGRSFGGAERE